MKKGIHIVNIKLQKEKISPYYFLSYIQNEFM